LFSLHLLRKRKQDYCSEAAPDCYPSKAPFTVAEMGSIFFPFSAMFCKHVIFMRDLRQLQEKARPNRTQHTQQSPDIFQLRQHTNMDCWTAAQGASHSAACNHSCFEYLGECAYLRIGHHDNRLKLGDSFGHISILLLSRLGIFSPQHAAVGPSHPCICMRLKFTCKCHTFSALRFLGVFVMRPWIALTE